MNIQLGKTTLIRGTLVQRYEYVVEQKRTYQNRRTHHDWYLIQGSFTGEASLKNAVLLPDKPQHQNQIHNPVVETKRRSFSDLLKLLETKKRSLLDLLKLYDEQNGNHDFIKLWTRTIFLKDPNSLRELNENPIMKQILDEFMAQHNYARQKRSSPTRMLYNGGTPAGKDNEVAYKTYPAYIVGTVIKGENGQYVYSDILEMALARSKYLTQQLFYIQRTLSELDLGMDTVTYTHHVLANPAKYDGVQIRLYGALMRAKENKQSEFYMVPFAECAVAINWKYFAIGLENHNKLIDKLSGTYAVTWGSAEPILDIDEAFSEARMIKQRNYTPPTTFFVSDAQIIGTIKHQPDHTPSVILTDIQIAANPATFGSYYIVTKS